jgi:hypothetical protein
VYPVGVLSALQQAYRCAREGWWKQAHQRLRSEWRSFKRRLLARNWRGIKCSLNGYLAEPTPFPEHMTRCGSGWTKKRALRSLERHGYPPA